MRSTSMLRTSLCLAIANAALAAQAVNIGFSSVGTYDLTGDIVTFTETVLNQQGGYGSLTSLTYSVDSAATPIFGSGTYTGAGGTLYIDFTLIDFATVPSTQSGYGTWVATGGTGTYANAVGKGTWAVNLDFDTFDSYTILRGNIEAVPEPASMAALGAGAAALVRRRRKA